MVSIKQRGDIRKGEFEKSDVRAPGYTTLVLGIRNPDLRRESLTAKLAGKAEYNDVVCMKKEKVD